MGKKDKAAKASEKVMLEAFKRLLSCHDQLYTSKDNLDVYQLVAQVCTVPDQDADARKQRLDVTDAAKAAGLTDIQRLNCFQCVTEANLDKFVTLLVEAGFSVKS